MSESQSTSVMSDRPLYRCEVIAVYFGQFLCHASNRPFGHGRKRSYKRDVRAIAPTWTITRLMRGGRYANLPMCMEVVAVAEVVDVTSFSAL